MKWILFHSVSSLCLKTDYCSDNTQYTLKKNILHNVSKLCLTIYIFWNVTTKSAIDAQISLYINEKNNA